MIALRIALSAALCAGPAFAAEDGLAPGAYEVAYRLEVPHVERYAVEAIATICVAAAPPPVLSANNPLAGCPAANLRAAGGELRFDILCPGRRNDRSEAHAVYRLSQGRFEGRIEMVMGGKNMTFVEIQSGRRTGSCEVAAQ